MNYLSLNYTVSWNHYEVTSSLIHEYILMNIVLYPGNILWRWLPGSTRYNQPFSRQTAEFLITPLLKRYMKLDPAIVSIFCNQTPYRPSYDQYQHFPLPLPIYIDEMSSCNYCAICATTYQGTNKYHERTTHSVSTQVQYHDLSIYTLQRQVDGKFACLHCQYTSPDPTKINRHCGQCAPPGIVHCILRVQVPG